MLVNSILRDSTALTIRDAEPVDAESIIELMRAITSETENLAYGSGDFKMTAEEERAYIEKVKGSRNSAFLLAFKEGALVGFAALSGYSRPKVAHGADLSMGVLKAHWGQGIAKELLKAIIDWAAASDVVSKINLLVRTDNTPAIKLYRSMGFEIEGRLTRDFKICGVYYESYYMGLCIG